jgi:1,4-alpha-glucan branching enzyme
VVAYRRKGKDPENDLLVILNLTPVVRHDWKVYTYGKSQWREIFNSDDKRYWGTGNVFNPDISVTSLNKNDNMYEINVHLPPLGAVVLK